MTRIPRRLRALASGATDKLDDYTEDEPPPRRKRVNNHTESDLQVRIVVKLRKLGLFVAHIPNGAHDRRSRMFAAKRGVVSGMPDLIVLGAGESCAFLEVKAPGQRVSERQAHTHAELRRYGFTVKVVTSVPEAVAAVGHDPREAQVEDDDYRSGAST